MLRIAITLPDFIDHEAEKIEYLLNHGFDYVHIRKPDWYGTEVEDLVGQIDPKYHPRLKLHDSMYLAYGFNIGGVHLNRREPYPPSCDCKLSRSCHSIEEMERELAKGIYEYVTLSPIYDSISKPGYLSTFSLDELSNHVRGKSVIALGGVTEQKLPELERTGFTGAAMLGAAWQIFKSDGDSLPKLKR